MAAVSDLCDGVAKVSAGGPSPGSLKPNCVT